MSRHHDAIKNDSRYKEFVKRVKEAAGYRCEQCGREDQLAADHVIPLDAGGAPFDPANGQCLCKPCNSRKGNRSTEEIRTNYYNPKYLDRL